MDVVVRASASCEKESEAAVLHSLPCAIQFNGPANVANYFVVENPSTEQSSSSGIISVTCVM
jgi:hypothetical protein